MFQKFTSSQYSLDLGPDKEAGFVIYDPRRQEVDPDVRKSEDGEGLLWIVGPVCGAVVGILLIVLIIIFVRYR